jgi:hypothetical protein
MTAPASATTTGPSYRSAGWAAITSGAIGLIAYGFLWAFLIKRMSGASEQTFVPLIRTHDVAVILQSIFLIPLVLTLGGIVGERSPGARRPIVVVGVAALSLMIISLVLITANLISDGFFMLFQGLLGMWLIGVNRRVSSVFPRGLTRFGIVVGVGLVIIAVFPIGFAIFVDPSLGPVPWDYQPPAGTEKADEILHNILVIGGFIGVATQPFWSAFIGRRLLKMGSLVTAGVTSERAA